MVKPGYDWNQSASSPKLEIPVPEPESSAEEPTSATLEPGRHRRVPSVILSPSPNTLAPLREGAPPVDVALSLDDGDILPLAQGPPTPYQNVISSPDFWGDLLDFLRLARISSTLTSVQLFSLAHVSPHGRTSRMHSRNSSERARPHSHLTKSPRFGITLVLREWQVFRGFKLAICIRHIWILDRSSRLRNRHLYIRRMKIICRSCHLLMYLTQIRNGGLLRDDDHRVASALSI